MPGWHCHIPAQSLWAERPEMSGRFCHRRWNLDIIHLFMLLPANVGMLLRLKRHISKQGFQSDVFRSPKTYCSWCFDGEEHNRWYTLRQFYPKLSRRWKIRSNHPVPSTSLSKHSKAVSTFMNSRSTFCSTRLPIQTSPRVTAGCSLFRMGQMAHGCKDVFTCRTSAKLYTQGWEVSHYMTTADSSLIGWDGCIQYKRGYIWRYDQPFVGCKFSIKILLSSLVKRWNLAEGQPRKLYSD